MFRSTPLQVESVVKIESDRVIVLGVDEEGEGTHFALQPAPSCIGEQRSADPTTSKALVHCQPAHPNCGDRGIARKLSRRRLGQVRHRHTRRCERVKARDDSSLDLQRHEAGRNATTNILRHLLLEVRVEGSRPARELRAIVPVEHFDDERRPLTRHGGALAGV